MGLGRGGFRDTSGQALVEYVVLLALLAVALIGVLILFRDAVGGVYAHTGNQIDQVTATPSTPLQGITTRARAAATASAAGMLPAGVPSGRVSDAGSSRTQRRSALPTTRSAWNAKASAPRGRPSWLGGRSRGEKWPPGSRSRPRRGALIG
jgi:Flp pilus assembly pilin Flp